MSDPAHDDTMIGTFADAQYADLAAEAARYAGFQVERRSGGVVAIQTGHHPRHAEEIRVLLAVFGAQEHTRSEVAHSGHAKQRCC